MNIGRLKDKKNREPLFSIYEIVGTIGTVDPAITDIDYLSLEDPISGEKMSVLAEWLMARSEYVSDKETFNQKHHLSNFSLEKVNWTL